MFGGLGWTPGLSLIWEDMLALVTSTYYGLCTDAGRCGGVAVTTSPGTILHRSVIMTSVSSSLVFPVTEINRSNGAPWIPNSEETPG